MAKKKEITGRIRLQIKAGGATPAPPVGPALGQHGLNIMDFCKQFNEKTKDIEKELRVPVKILVYKDKSFSFTTGQPVVVDLLKKYAGIPKGSGDSLKEKAGKITKKQAEEIAQRKMPDLNANSIEKAVKIIEGTARNMGIIVE